jgi:Second Messenger Oligonucleotide or Dinucleotide Synthetase domain
MANLFDLPTYHSNALTTLASFASLPTVNVPSITVLNKWIAVRERFKQFHDNITLKPLQLLDGHTKRAGVVSCLNRAYYERSHDFDNSFLVGSWGKGTAVRPPRDVDVYFLLPAAVYHRFQDYIGRRQSALLQEVKDVLLDTYPNTDMRGDGQVIIVNFGSYCVEVVPAFETTTPGSYLICDTNDGGCYKTTMPFTEAQYIDVVNTTWAQNLRPLICIIKAWQAECSVPIKSFFLELIAADFIAQSPWRMHDWFWFDWIVRDFFAYLYHRANGVIVVPGTMDVIQLGDEWQSRAETAYFRAFKACEHERDNRVAEAGDEWQKIFGSTIPCVI